jgi:TRAP-type C4-dicarboxylate transport system substrate-binding protein
LRRLCAAIVFIKSRSNVLRQASGVLLLCTCGIFPKGQWAARATGQAEGDPAGGGFEPTWALLVRFGEEVEEAGKAISIEIFDKGQLYIDTQVVDAVASGAIEMGGAGTYQFAKKIPDISIVEQPFLLNFEALLRAAVGPESEIRKLIDQTVLEATGVRVLWWQAAGTSVFFTKGKDATDPQVIKGKRVRVFSQITAQMTKACGGTPTVISTSKMHEAMKDGAVDLAMGSITSVEPRELWKVADIITMTHHVPDRVHAAHQRAHLAVPVPPTPDHHCRDGTGRGARHPRPGVGDRSGRLRFCEGEGHAGARLDPRPGGRVARLQRRRAGRLHGPGG